MKQVITMGYGTEMEEFESRQEQEISLFSTASRPNLGPTSYPLGTVGYFPGGKVAGT
jgi:hypothetical protein